MPFYRMAVGHIHLARRSFHEPFAPTRGIDLDASFLVERYWVANAGAALGYDFSQGDLTGRFIYFRLSKRY